MHGIQSKRRKYGLTHWIAATIHAGMGQDLPAIVTKVTALLGDPDYALWDKAQLIVLISRTHYAKDIYFVGEPKKTSAALADLFLQDKPSTQTIYLTYASSCALILKQFSNN